MFAFVRRDPSRRHKNQFLYFASCFGEPANEECASGTMPNKKRFFIYFIFFKFSFPLLIVWGPWMRHLRSNRGDPSPLKLFLEPRYPMHRIILSFPFVSLFADTMHDNSSSLFLTAICAMDEWYRLPPVSLPRENPIFEFVSDGFFAKLFRDLRHS